MEIRTKGNKDLAFRFVDGIFYVNSKPINIHSVHAEAKITLETKGAIIIITTSSRESEIMIKGKLKYDSLEGLDE